MLDLAPHPEGGYYRETFRDPRTDADGRSVSTLIYFLLGVGDVSAWHRVDAAEVWHYYAGAPLVMPGGECIGTLCVIDRDPRRLEPMEQRQLQWLADLVMRELELRRLSNLDPVTTEIIRMRCAVYHDCKT